MWQLIPYIKTDAANYNGYYICTTQLNYIQEPCIMIIAQYYKGFLIKLEKRKYTKDTESFAVFDNVDTVKIMVWQDMNGQKPITESETVYLTDN